MLSQRISSADNCCCCVQFPDFERVGWFNDIIAQLWPYVNQAVSAMAREQLDPMLSESKPGWIQSIKLYRQSPCDAALRQHWCSSHGQGQKFLSVPLWSSAAMQAGVSTRASQSSSASA